MKIIFYTIFLVFLLFSCQNQNKSQKVIQLQPRIVESFPEKKEESKFDCKNTMQWLRENAITINPDTFSFSPEFSPYDSIYQRIDTLLYTCFDWKKVKKAKDYFRDYKGKEYYESSLISDAKLRDICINDKNQINAFTILGSKEIVTGLTYISIKPNTTQILDVVNIARLGGDIGTIINENSIWVNDSTLIRTTNISRLTLDNIFYQAKVQINLHKNGKISLSNPQTLIDIPFEKVLKKESSDYKDK